MAVQLQKRLFTTNEYHQMAAAGILSEDDRVELLAGEIVEMTPISSQHVACVNRLTHLFTGRLGPRAIVSVQNPLHLDDYSEPQPDLALLRPRADFYADRHPQAQDVLLLVEVAHTSAAMDRTVKLPLYARAGVPEVWLVDLAGGQVEVYREPQAEGYQAVAAYSRGQELAPLAFPEVTVAVAAVLGD